MPLQLIKMFYIDKKHTFVNNIQLMNFQCFIKPTFNYSFFIFVN